MDGEIEFLDGVLEGEIVNDTPALTGELILENDDRLALSGDLVISPTEIVNVPAYDGSYSVIPLIDTETILETTGKCMEDDVVVLAIPYYETTNDSGGYTVIIG